jgi:hypothetical protein
MAQTAVSWLLDRILEGKCQVVYTKDIGYLFYQTEDIIEQAKQKEKEQIQKSFNYGYLDYQLNFFEDGEQYYNETYGK